MGPVRSPPVRHLSHSGPCLIISRGRRLRRNPSCCHRRTARTQAIGNARTSPQEARLPIGSISRDGGQGSRSSTSSFGAWHESEPGIAREGEMLLSMRNMPEYAGAMPYSRQVMSLCACTAVSARGWWEGVRVVSRWLDGQIRAENWVWRHVYAVQGHGRGADRLLLRTLHPAATGRTWSLLPEIVSARQGRPPILNTVVARRHQLPKSRDNVSQRQTRAASRSKVALRRRSGEDGRLGGARGWCETRSRLPSAVRPRKISLSVRLAGRLISSRAALGPNLTDGSAVRLVHRSGDGPCFDKTDCCPPGQGCTTSSSTAR